MNSEFSSAIKQRILIVDDEDITRRMLQQVLQEAGYSLLEATDGAEGVERFRQGRPDLVLLDVRMPKMNGFDACQAMRKFTQLQYTPILMLTGLNDVVAAKLAFDAGATDFITKPINWVLLAQRVQYALRTRDTERELRQSRQLLAHAKQLARMGHWSYEIGTRAIYWSQEMYPIFGVPEATGLSLKYFLSMVHPQDRSTLGHFIKRIVLDARPYDFEFRIKLADGSIRIIHALAEACRDQCERPCSVFGVAQDITRHKEAEARLSYLSHYDSLTGLPNRVLFRDRLLQAMAETKRSHRKVAIVFLDVERFKDLNATLGRAKGDLLLQEISERLRSYLRPSDTLSRDAGDHFSIMLPGISQEKEIAHIAQRLLGGFAAPFDIAGQEVFVTANLGISVYPADGVEAESLLMNASAAMSLAKERAGSRYRFYKADMNNRAMERLALETALRHALKRNEFILYYQPRVDLQQQRVVGVEALLRWKFSPEELVLPAKFIPLLEETELILPVGEWVIRTACTQMSETSLSVSVNLSPKQFGDASLVTGIEKIIEETGFTAERLELEITESILMRDKERAIATLADLRAMGIGLSIDDFGTGYSSLAYLKELPVHILKIDRSFVADLLHDQATSAIVRSTIELGHNLGLSVVAEGLEDARAWGQLMQLGCDMAQGYHITRPLPLHELRTWLSASSFSIADFPS